MVFCGRRTLIQKTQITRKRVDAFPHREVKNAYRDNYDGCSKNSPDSVREIDKAMIETRQVSAMTIVTYTNVLRKLHKHIEQHPTEFPRGLLGLTPSEAQAFLNFRSTQVSRKIVKLDRNAIHFMLRHITGKLAIDEMIVFDEEILLEKNRIPY